MSKPESERSAVDPKASGASGGGGGARRAPARGLPAMALALPAMALALLAGCSGDAGGDEPSDAVRVARDIAAASFAEDRLTEALAAIRPLVEAPDPAPEDLLRAGIVALALGRDDEARTHLDAAREAMPESPAVHYNLGQLAAARAEFEAALASFERAHELAPDDFPTRLALANTLEDLDREAEAEAHYRALLEVGVDHAGSWYLIPLYRLAQLLNRRGDDAAAELFRERDRLEARGISPPSSSETQRGTFGRLSAPAPWGTSVEPPAPHRLDAAGARAVALAGDDLSEDELRGLADAELAVCTVFENWTRKDGPSGLEASDVGPPDVVAWGAPGIVLLEARGGQGYRARRVADGPVDLVRTLDVDNDGDLDFLVVRGAEVELLWTNPDGWTADASVLPELPSAPRDVEPVDFDHEGDLDLLLVGAFGARLWRNDGLAIDAGEGTFTDVSREAGLPADGELAWCLVEDFDTDQDVDLLLGSASRVVLADNLRGGAFADRSSALPAEAASADEPLAADLDGDARPDLWYPTRPARILRGRPSGSFQVVADALAASGGLAAGTRVHALDLDLDGALDGVWVPEAGGLAARQAVGLSVETESAVAGLDADALAPGDAFAPGDLDRDGAVDLFVAGSAEPPRVVPGAAAGARSITLALEADKDNRRGVGAVVEVRAGSVYRRIFWTGEPRTVGIGAAERADLVRVTWPTGVVQHEIGVPAGARRTIRRVERMAGSCPFLYTWNGSEYEFVTDVLGITPLGLPLAPGVLVPPDHDEYVLIRGEQLAPREADGRAFYELQLTEELREVTYLDRVRLDVVDHPEGTELYPDERFCFPPFPGPEPHVVRTPLAPQAAVDGDGGDWTAALERIDGEYAIPFEPLRRQLLGLATPHALELRFPMEGVAAGERLRLVCTGWFFWTDASVNVASARTPGVDFVPPVLSVPDAGAESGWRAVGPPVGFPAGKRKTMVIDVTEWLDRDDPRLRLSSTLRIYWDSIRLAVGDDAPARVRSLDPAEARLWERGFSRPRVVLEGHQLEWFDWDRLASEARWNQHPGLYTRLGDALELVEEVDDRFVIMGAGDALRVRFDASALPPPREGDRRDFLLYLDGWAKDRDPNTVEALYVEPLPFHGMSAYPYGADEAFPDDELHRRWRREWNTRPARRWIPPLVPDEPSRDASVPAGLVRG